MGLILERLELGLPADVDLVDDVAQHEVRLPGVVGNRESVEFDSHADGLLEGPSYTRPASWRGHEVPPVLLSGDHAAIARWRREQSLRRTLARRPDLLAALPDDALSDADRALFDGD